LRAAAEESALLILTAAQLRHQYHPQSSSSLLKNLESESFLVLSSRCWGGVVELDEIF